jgi:hypothetical protein
MLAHGDWSFLGLLWPRLLVLSLVFSTMGRANHPPTHNVSPTNSSPARVHTLTTFTRGSAPPPVRILSNLPASKSDIPFYIVVTTAVTFHGGHQNSHMLSRSEWSVGACAGSLSLFFLWVFVGSKCSWASAVRVRRERASDDPPSRRLASYFACQWHRPHTQAPHPALYTALGSILNHLPRATTITKQPQAVSHLLPRLPAPPNHPPAQGAPTGLEHDA